MMTALDTGSVATVSFLPKQTFNNVHKVCWDQNMNNLGEGKWLNVMVLPAAQYSGDPAYAAKTGLPFGGIPQRLPPGSVDFTWLRGSVMGNKVQANGQYGAAGDNGSHDFYVWSSQEPPSHGMGTSSAPRFTICMDDTANTLVVERPDGTTDTLPFTINFPTGAVRAIFQDASYNPTKHGGTTSALTWHWDNIQIG
jgi:hypothetical protein